MSAGDSLPAYRNQQLFAKVEGADLQPVVNSGVLRGFEHDYIGIGLDAGLAQRGNIPFLPDWFFCLYVQRIIGLLLVIVQEIVEIVLVSACAIGAPRLRDACRLLNGDPVPAF